MLRAWRPIQPLRRKLRNLLAGRSWFIFVFMDRPGAITLLILRRFCRAGANSRLPSSTTAWYIFDNTASGAALGNALELIARI